MLEGIIGTVKSWFTQKRRTIILNAVVFGVVGAFGSLATSLSAGITDEEQIAAAAVIAIGIGLGAAVGYFNNKSEEFVTGTKAKKRIKLGI